MPAPVKTAVGFVPLIGNVANAAFGYSEVHKFELIAQAKKLEKKGTLSAEARRHLHAYERASAEAERAYNAFLKSFEKHV